MTLTDQIVVGAAVLALLVSAAAVFYSRRALQVARRAAELHHVLVEQAPLTLDRADRRGLQSGQLCLGDVQLLVDKERDRERTRGRERSEDLATESGPGCLRELEHDRVRGPGDV